MELTIKDRLLVAHLYPKESNLVTQILVKDIITKVEITQDDVKKYSIVSNAKGIVWNKDLDKAIDIILTDKEISFLQGQIKRLDGENKITQENLDLCLKIQKYEVKED
ncbi:MAG: hypothetical protein IIC74_09055 [Bacteroidetes bacterium]|nr:hypothetical protein [Bacteroidota bacterium]